MCNKDLTGAQTVNHDAIMMTLNQMMIKLFYRQQLIVLMALDKMIIYVMKTLLNPISKYASDKVAVEIELMKRKPISFRLATVFGMSPKMRIDLGK